MATEVVSIGLALDTSGVIDSFRKTAPKLDQEVRSINAKIEAAAAKTTKAVDSSFAGLAKNTGPKIKNLGETLGRLAPITSQLTGEVGRLSGAIGSVVALGPQLLSPWSLLITGIAAATAAAVAYFKNTDEALQKQADETRKAREEWDDYFQSVTKPTDEATKKLEGFSKSFNENVISPLVSEQAELRKTIAERERYFNQIVGPFTETKRRKAEVGREIEDLRDRERRVTAMLLEEERTRTREVARVRESLAGPADQPPDPRDPSSAPRGVVIAGRDGALARRDKSTEKAAEEARKARLAQMEIDAKENARLQGQIDDFTLDSQERMSALYLESVESTRAEALEIQRKAFADEMALAEETSKARELAIRRDAQMIQLLVAPTMLVFDALGAAFQSAIASTEDFGEAFKKALGAIMINIGAQLVVAGIAATTLGLLATVFPFIGLAFGIPIGAGLITAGVGAAAIGVGTGLIAGGVALGGRGVSIPGADSPSGAGGGGSRGPSDSGLRRNRDESGRPDTVINLNVNRPLATSGSIARDLEDFGGDGADVRIGR